MSKQQKIKFDIVARNIHFNEIHHEVYTLEQIWVGNTILTWLRSNNCEMLAKRLYTGLKDRNGIEIYQGDIVRGHHSIGVVKFESGSFVVNWDDTMLNKVMYFWDDNGFEGEVIGNI